MQNLAPSGGTENGLFINKMVCVTDSNKKILNKILFFFIFSDNFYYLISSLGALLKQEVFYNKTFLFSGLKTCR